MSNALKTESPFPLYSKFTGPLAYNFAGEGDGDDGGSSDDDDPDAPPADTPEGKKWKQLREDKKAALVAAEKAKEEAIRADERAKTAEDLLAKVQGKSTEEEVKEEEPEVVVPEGTNKEDAEYVNKLVGAALQNAGVDGKEIKQALDDIAKGQQQLQADRIFDEARQTLEKEFEGSVPFDYEAALTYAKENNLGIVGSTALQALRIAHKEMNEEKFDEWKAAGRKPGKSAPSLESSEGPAKTGAAEENEEIQPASVEEAAAMAHKMLEDAE